MQTDILGYGKQSAFAQVPEYATVAAVTREDLLQWHQQHTTPNNIIFGVVGDFDSNEMEATLRKVFGDWPKGEKVRGAEGRDCAGQAGHLRGRQKRREPERDPHDRPWESSAGTRTTLRCR